MRVFTPGWGSSSMYTYIYESWTVKADWVLTAGKLCNMQDSVLRRGLPRYEERCRSWSHRHSGHPPRPRPTCPQSADSGPARSSLHRSPTPPSRSLQMSRNTLVNKWTIDWKPWFYLSEVTTLKLPNHVFLSWIYFQNFLFLKDRKLLRLSDISWWLSLFYDKFKDRDVHPTKSPVLFLLSPSLCPPLIVFTH